MTFETALASCGRLIDNVIAWHISLPWYYEVPLYMVYFTIISYNILKQMPHGGPL